MVIGELDQAKEKFKKALELNPEMQEIYFILS